MSSTIESDALFVGTLHQATGVALHRACGCADRLGEEAVSALARLVMRRLRVAVSLVLAAILESAWRKPAQGSGSDQQ
jgi:hypothetical protein